MKISYNHFLQHINPGVSLEEVCRLLTDCGLEVEGTEKFESVKGSLRGLITGLVISKEKHPNADKLSLTKVDIGAGELLSIVCGAPNVQAGQKVVVAPVDCTVYPKEGEPFVIKKAKIRGELSEGMICAEDEIGLGDGHDGILVLDEKTPIGKPLQDLYTVIEDTVIEIGLTANRGDAASHRGTARDVSALLDVPLNPLPEVKLQFQHQKPIEVSVECPEFCPRYSGVLIKGVTVKESPNWLKNFLQAIGINPKNNIVDITNFILHSIGQPLHAFDANKIKGDKVIVKLAQKDSVFVGLDNEEHKLSGAELMIWNKDEPMAMAGVMGGRNSAVAAHTKDIFIESAYFEPGMVRKTAKNHALNTDSSFRFERGTDPHGTIHALELAVYYILQEAGGSVASELIDVISEQHIPKPATVSLHNAEIERICGIHIQKEKVESILQRLGITIVSNGKDKWELSIPPFKSDVTREIDVIEEIIRIYGFEHIPLNETMQISLPKPLSNTQMALHKKSKIAQYLRSRGFHEMQTNSMTKSKFFHPEDSTVINVKNPLSADLSVMRQSLIPGVLEAIAYNQKRKAESVLLFEYGKSYKKKEEEKYVESNLLCIAASGITHPLSWESKPQQANVFFLKGILSGLANLLGLHEINEKNGLIYLGSPDTGWMKIADCKAPTVVAEINLDKLIGTSQKRKFVLAELPKFPSVRRDLSLVIDKSVSFDQISMIAFKSENKYLKDLFVFDVFEGNPLTEDKKSYSIAFLLLDAEKTMSDNQIDSIMNRLITNFEKEIGASIRK